MSVAFGKRSFAQIVSVLTYDYGVNTHVFITYLEVLNPVFMHLQLTSWYHSLHIEITSHYFATIVLHIQYSVTVLLNPFLPGSRFVRLSACEFETSRDTLNELMLKDFDDGLLLEI